MKRSTYILLAAAFLAPACSAADPEPPATTMPATTAATEPPATTSSTTTALPASTTTTEPLPVVEPLESYRFVLTLGLTADPGRGDVHQLFELAGEATTFPPAMRIVGELRDDSFDLVSDGSDWWDLEHPEHDLSVAYVEEYLGNNGFILPDQIAVLLIEEETWVSARSEIIGGAPASHIQRFDVTKGRDWELGNLALLDVWRDEFNEIVKYTAWYATGDNTGFPVTTWEVTERNPELEITIPG